MGILQFHLSALLSLEKPEKRCKLQNEDDPKGLLLLVAVFVLYSFSYQTRTSQCNR